MNLSNMNCEIAKSNYMSAQSDINANMREILIDWLFEVCVRFRLNHLTLFYAVNYLDRFLSLKDIHRHKLQLVGCVCLFIASKFNQIFPPEPMDFVTISDKCFTSTELLEWETIVLTSLQFNLSTSTAYHYVMAYLANQCSTLNSQEQHMVYYVTFSLLQHYPFLQYESQFLAAASIELVHLVEKKPSILHQLVAPEKLNETQTLVKLISQYMLKRKDGKYKAIHKCFERIKYDQASKIFHEHLET